MKNTKYKRYVVYAIVFLFIGVGIIPSIYGSSGNRNNYVNSFWKFDEGQGTTAHDSSGHNYDGTIYGAIWTSGKVGLALNFDGVNDYINLDDYAHEVSWNKTDDLIFSFYIKTSQNQHGKIFSASMDTGTNPEMHIFLEDNGTIGFKAEVTNCGFTVWTENPYNNNEWHYVEIWYNGISLNPTVIIKVDGVVDAEITHWVCPYTNNEFDMAKIGRRSHELTDYFDGALDEFKVIKYQLGNKQEPPEISGPQVGDPNIEYEYSFTTYDPEEDETWLKVDWGDGQVQDWIGPYDYGEEVILTHQWEENGTYDIKAQSKDIWHYSFSSHYQVRIGNQAPTAPSITGPTLGDKDKHYQFRFNSTDFEEDDLLYYIDWDDGNIENWIGPYKWDEEVVLSHSWTEYGIYNIQAKAKDIPANEESDWSIHTMRIGNRDPSAPNIDGPKFGRTGVEHEFRFNSTDLDNDMIELYVEWGDDKNTGWIGPYESGEIITLSHSWNNMKVYTVKAKTRDELGGISDWGTLRVTMPKFYFNCNFLNWLFERFQNGFPILKYIFGL